MRYLNIYRYLDLVCDVLVELRRPCLGTKLLQLLIKSPLPRGRAKEASPTPHPLLTIASPHLKTHLRKSEPVSQNIVTHTETIFCVILCLLSPPGYRLCPARLPHHLAPPNTTRCWIGLGRREVEKTLNFSWKRVLYFR